MKRQRLITLMVLASAPAFAMAEPPQDASLGAPVAESTLSQYRGARDVTFNLQNTTAQLDNNQAVNTVSGGNLVTGGAFSGASGLATVIQNSGNNVVIQNATIVDVKLQ